MWATTHLCENSFHPAYHLNTYSMVVGIPYRELTHQIKWEDIYTNFFVPAPSAHLEQCPDGGTSTTALESGDFKGSQLGMQAACP